MARAEVGLIASLPPFPRNARRHMSDESGSSLARMLAVLDFFTLQRYEWTVEELSEATGYTASSTYRYVRALGRAGLLARLPLPAWSAA